MLPLVGELPEAFDVAKQGDELHFAFRTDRPGTAEADHQCIVRYDSKRGVYRYEYVSDLTFTATEPFRVNAFELIDPLTQNNHPPGPEVTYRWNDLKHRWHLYQGPGQRWYRYPLIDHLLECNNLVSNACEITSSNLLVAAVARRRTTLWRAWLRGSYFVSVATLASPTHLLGSVPESVTLPAFLAVAAH